MAASNDRYPQQLLVDIRTFFESEKKSVQKRLTQIDEADPYQDPEHAVSNADALEDASEDVQHQNAEAQREALEKKLKEIDEALERVDNGTYGFCKKCGKLIDTDRLSSNPFTLYCITCAK